MADAKPLDPQTAAEMRTALQLAQRGDLAGARAAGERALALGRDPEAVHAFLGMLCCQAGDFAAGIPHLRSARAARPGDLTIAGNLATALLQSGDAPGALGVLTPALADQDASRRLWRLRGYILQSTDDFAGAAEAYRRVVTAFPDDFESWNNLGNACAGTGDAEGSLEALARAAALRPDSAPVRLNHAATLAAMGRADAAIEALLACERDFPGDPKPLVELAAVYKQQARDPEALGALERAVARDRRDAELHVKLGIEQVISWKMAEAEAERSFRAAIALEPAHAEAHVLLGVLLEHANREDDLPALLAEAEAARVAEGATAFIRALALRREKKFAEGLTMLDRVDPDIEPIRVAQLRGQFLDRLGETDAAFEAFRGMNAMLAEDPSDPVRRGAEFRDSIRRDRALVTPAWVASWTKAEAPQTRPAPVFLAGFPRSGTTLLDTMLMGHPKVRVLEERPTIVAVERALGGLERLATLDDAGLARLREAYYAEVAEWIDLPGDAMLVDKMPLHLNKVPIIHRIFPDAKFILALRHPCDAVLSCYITNFRLNNAMSNFIDLETAAELYDLSFGFWEQSRAILPVQAHEIAYERLVADSEAELRPLFDFLGLDWQEDVLDHRKTAAGRGVITTASYAQVTEPIYKRAAGRWERYRAQMAPVLPVLAPWAERYGYSL